MRADEDFSWSALTLPASGDIPSGMPPNWLAKPVNFAKATWNVVSSLGPFLISQADSTSEAWARHQGRLATVDVTKELLMGEVRTLSEVRKSLLEKLVTAEPEERVRIRRDLDEIGASIRQLNIGAKALDYLPPPNATEPKPATATASTDQTSPESEVTSHWMDKFNDLARAHNEPWRDDLLARALATEATAPSTVSPRALWILGTLEESAFNSFAILLDLMSQFGNQFYIPNHHSFVDRDIPGAERNALTTINHITFSLGETGLLGNLMGAQLMLRGGGVVVQYHDARAVIRLSAPLTVSGFALSNLGQTIALFYERKNNPLGREIYDAWIAGLDKTKYQATVLL